MNGKSLGKFTLALTILSSALLGCDVVKDTLGVANRSPIISSFDYTPKSAIRKTDVISFTVVARDPEGKALDYKWTASKGTLTADSGSTVNWKPLNQENDYEKGLSTVSVIVTDGVMSTTASVNIYVNDEGKVSVEPAPSPSPSASPITSPTPVPSSSPTASPIATPSPTASPTATPSPLPSLKILFQEEFENGYLDERWSVSYSSNNNGDYLTWKKLNGDLAYKGSGYALLTGPTDEVLANTSDHSEVRITSQSIDLSKSKLPRLSFYIKSDANSSDAVNYKVYWSKDGADLRPLNINFTPDKNWKEVNIDLLNIPAIKESSSGYLTIAANINGNINAFKGPMLDNIMIYDASIQ